MTLTILATAAAKKGNEHDPLKWLLCNLRPPPEFVGDVEETQNFKRYIAQVGNLISIAKNIFDSEETAPSPMRR